MWDSGVYPGVGYGSGGRVYHAYYQWVPYYLLMLASAFYLPHLLWKVVDSDLCKAVQLTFIFRLLKEEGLPCYSKRIRR